MGGDGLAATVNSGGNYQPVASIPRDIPAEADKPYLSTAASAVGNTTV